MLKEIMRSLKRPIDDIREVEILLSPCRDLVVGIFFRYGGSKFHSMWGGTWTAAIVEELRAKYIFPVRVKVFGDTAL